MNITVHKYGGTSVGSPERIKAVAKRISEIKKTSDHIVLVVSAMGKTTDELISLSKSVSSNPHSREYDALVSNGENISAALMAMALIEEGIDAISLTGYQAGVNTEGPYSRSKIRAVDTRRIHEELDKNRVVVVTGFQGINDFGDITTIGRGGSDTSAVVLAVALGAKVCDICTDVDGIYTTDPRKVKSARKLDEISYDEMLELASLGASVLHPRSVEVAKEHHVIIHLRSSFESTPGTLVKEAKTMEVNRAVTGVTLNESEAQISIIEVPDEPGVAGKLFGKLADGAINVDMIIQTMGQEKNNSISFTVSEDDLTNATQITKKLLDELGGSDVHSDNNISKVSIVGVGMMSRPGVAAQLFQTLGDNGINIRMISTSEIKVSCLVDQNDGRKALELLHAAYELDQS